MNIFENRNSKKLAGFDLRIDSKIQEVCDLSNKSSSHTRAVLYILVVISITSIISVINTLPYANWTKQRIENSQHELGEINKKLKSSTSLNLIDSLGLELKKSSLATELGKEIENKRGKIGIVELPIIGNTFDVNNLAILTGISFIIILLILRYTASREKKNLRIALHAITQRYPDPEDYINEVSKLIDIVPEVLITRGDHLNKAMLEDKEVRQFNLTRRKYHYNYLTMNEIFNTPKDQITRDEEVMRGKKFKNSLIAKIVEDNLLFFPFIVYTIIVLNDFISSGIGSTISQPHTYTQLIVSYIFLCHIATLCKECNNQKITSLLYFNQFEENNCKYDYNKIVVNIPKRKVYRIFYPIWLVSFGLMSTIIQYFKHRGKKKRHIKQRSHS